MKVISLKANGWRSPDDFYSAYLAAMGAPAWHGRNLDALFDSLIDGINEVRAPFKVQVLGVINLPSNLKDFLERVAAAFDDAREQGSDVSFEVIC